MPCNKEALLKRLKKMSLNIQVSKAYPFPSHKLFSDTGLVIVVHKTDSRATESNGLVTDPSSRIFSFYVP